MTQLDNMAANPYRNPFSKKKAKPARRNPIYRSSWEEHYANYLECQRRDFKILDWSYEDIKLKISNGGIYTPDFLVITDEEIQFHEVKGLRREAGMVRLRVAAHSHRWARFLLVTKEKGGNWKIDEVK